MRVLIATNNNTPPPHGVGNCDRFAIVRGSRYGNVGGDSNIVVYASVTKKIVHVNIVRNNVS